MSEPEKRKRCTAAVWKRDTYRVSRRGGRRFAMHYNKEQCSHAAKEDGRCGKHPRDRFFTDCDWYEFVD